MSAKQLEQYEKNMIAINEIRNKLAAMKMAMEKDRPFFTRDFPTSSQDKIIATFTYTKTEKSDKWWDRTNTLVCNILAFSHDFDRLADYLNEHRILIPKIPSYSPE